MCSIAACAVESWACLAQVVNAYVTKDQDNNIILVAVDHIKAGEEVQSDFYSCSFTLVFSSEAQGHGHCWCTSMHS